MPKPITPTVFIKTMHRGFILPLRLSGPISQPAEVDISTASKILLSGIELFEYDVKSKTTRKLTLVNLGTPFVTDVETVQVSKAPTATISVNLGVAEPESNKIEMFKDTMVMTADTVLATDIELTNNEDGTVDQTVIDWLVLSKSQQKKLKARIAELDAKV